LHLHGHNGLEVNQDSKEQVGRFDEEPLKMESGTTLLQAVWVPVAKSKKYKKLFPYQEISS